jgi:hypothetical protein
MIFDRMDANELDEFARTERVGTVTFEMLCTAGSDQLETVWNQCTVEYMNLMRAASELATTASMCARSHGVHFLTTERATARAVATLNAAGRFQRYCERLAHAHQIVLAKERAYREATVA